MVILTNLMVVRLMLDGEVDGLADLFLQYQKSVFHLLHLLDQQLQFGLIMDGMESIGIRL